MLNQPTSIGLTRRVVLDTTADPGASLRVLLVSMPMQSMARPSIQIGLLAEVGRRAGHHIDTLHAALDFGRAVNDRFEVPSERGDRVLELLEGRDLYSTLGNLRSPIGDWLFSVEAFGTDAPDSAGDYLSVRSAEDREIADDDTLLAIRDEIVPAYLDDMCALITAGAYDIVGFTSTFQQNTASFALARRLKERNPRLLTLFGGANFDGEMGLAYMEAVADIDLALRGECDETFAQLLDRLAGRRTVHDIPGVLVRAAAGVVVSGPEPEPVESLEHSPTPDYLEYFERAEALGVVPADVRHHVEIPFETSRGCWWGQKRHCTFCGLNGQTMRFRSKAPAHMINELEVLSARHSTLRFSAVDNIIDTDYLDTSIRRLADRGTDFDLFYEVKADLTREQLALLRRAGVTRMQPGIESLSSHVLGLMRKGTRAAWNVNLLRWAEFYGIGVAWNLLWGFPGEADADYHEQAQAIGLLHHLQPPGGVGRIWLERFSPMFTEVDTFGSLNRRPASTYEYVYPGRLDLDRAAYYFDYDVEPGTIAGARAIDGMVDAVVAWEKRRASGQRPELVRFRAPAFTRIVDTRGDGPARVHRLDGIAAAIYELCMDRPLTAAAIAERLGDVPVEPVAVVLEGFAERGLVFKDRALYLSLALPPAMHADRR